MADERVSVAGLEAPVTLDLDRWGVAHIRASSAPDLFFAQGFNAARDRLWQIDLWRKRGLGRLAADFGPGFLAQDRASRLFLYRGDMDAEWAAYGPDARVICEAFTRGINAYIDLLDREPGRLPPEFAALGTRPSRWSAEDVVRVRTHGWTRNVLSEVLRARVLAGADGETDQLRMRLDPPQVPHLAPGLDLASIPAGVLDVYRLATAPVIFTDGRLSAMPDQAWTWSSVTPSGEVVRADRPQGSNNWAVHGSRTVTGRPILASDPHRLHAVPSLRHLVHLTAPGLDVIGAVEPSFPGITIGHNEDAAFGLTLFLGPDQEDLYVYETRPGDPSAYRYGDTWESMRVVHESIAIHGAGAETVTLKFTRHGPVVFEDVERRRAYAIRSVWTEPGSAPYGAGLMTMRARTSDEFRRAMRQWVLPAVSQVYADRHGEIAWVTGGLTPRRRHWDGLLPVPGDGRYEWDGFLDPGVLPASTNPPEGFVASANAMNLPKDWDREQHPMGFEWDDPSRRDRLHEVLGSGVLHSVDAACALQTDVVSLPARRLSALLDVACVDESPAREAATRLKTWDCRLSVDSGSAALFEVWWSRHLRPAVFALLAPDPQVRALVLPGDLETVLEAIQHPDGRWGHDPARARDRMVIATLTSAFAECVERLGPDVDAWSWGRLHQCGFEHGLSRISARPPGLDVAARPVGGSESTLMKAAYRPSDFRVVLGASVRMVCDVGDWDRSVWINTPGQSGDPRSPHYADLADQWALGQYVPMAYSRERVARETTRRITLEPSRSP